MATVNNRLSTPQAMTINGVDAGGLMTARISAGYDNVMRSSPDGLQVAIVDREIQYVRGTVVTQDWIEAINLLTGTVGTYVFYQRKSGVAAATGYVLHTITNPVIHRFNIRQTKGGYMAAAFDFECKAADETEGFADMWVMTDSQAAPTYVSAARGGWRVESAQHGGSLDIKHVTGFNIDLALPLAKACNDSDVGYTCVDARLDGIMCGGSIGFQDGSIATNQLLILQLLAAARGDLVITVSQGSGGADKVLTLAGVIFNNPNLGADAGSVFDSFGADFEVTNDTTTQLTLEGENKIITIA